MLFDLRKKSWNFVIDRINLDQAKGKDLVALGRQLVISHHDMLMTE